MTPADPNKTPGEMHLFDHLGELRRRLVISLCAVFLMSVVALTFANKLFVILAEPFFRAFPNDILIGTGPAEALILKLKVAFFAGLILSCPIVFYQIWLFVAPGLHDHERRLVIPFMAASTSLFLLGVLFCYSLVFPIAFKFFAEQYRSVNLTPNIRMSEHLSLMITGMVGFGVIFELPIIAYLLGRAGIISRQFLLDYLRHAIVVIFIVAAIFSPPDVLSQFLMAIPLLILYGVSYLVLWYVEVSTSNVAPSEGEGANLPK